MHTVTKNEANKAPATHDADEATTTNLTLNVNELTDLEHLINRDLLADLILNNLIHNEAQLLDNALQHLTNLLIKTHTQTSTRRPTRHQSTSSRSYASPQMRSPSTRSARRSRSTKCSRSTNSSTPRTRPTITTSPTSCTAKTSPTSSPTTVRTNTSATTTRSIPT